MTYAPGPLRDASPEAIIEAYKREVDPTMIRENLRRTVQERIDNFLRALRLADEMKQAGTAKPRA